MLRAVVHSHSGLLRDASSTNEVFLFECCCVFDFSTLSKTSKVGVVASEASVEGKFLERIVLKLVEEGIIRVFEAVMLVDTFNCSSFKGLLNNLLLEIARLSKFIFDYFAVSCFNLGFTRRAVHKAKENTGAYPSSLYFSH